MPSSKDFQYEHLGPGSGNPEAPDEVAIFVRDMTKEATQRAVVAVHDVARLCDQAPDGSCRVIDVMIGAAVSVTVSLLKEVMRSMPHDQALHLAERALHDIAAFTLLGCSHEEAKRRAKNEHQ